MSIEKQIKDIDSTINIIKTNYERAKDEAYKITSEYIIDLQFMKMDLLFKESRLNRLVNFCNTGKFEG